MIILAVVLAVFLAVVGAIAAKHWDNLMALYAARTTTTENIVAKAETSKQNQQEILEKQGVKVKPPSLDEMESLINGDLSLEDFKSKLIINDDTSESPAQSNDSESITREIEAAVIDSNSADVISDQKSVKSNDSADQTNPSKPDNSIPPTNQQNTPKPEASPNDSSGTSNVGVSEQNQEAPEPEIPKLSSQELIYNALEELYAYEAELLSRLGELKQEALADYKARGGKKEDLIAVGMEGLDKCYELEKDADKKVGDVLNKLENDLNEIGADSSIAQELWEYYCDEKVNTKTYYLNKYL